MKYFNNLVIRVFCYENEDFEKIKKVMLKLFPSEENRINLNIKKAMGFNEKEIKIIEVKLNKNKQILNVFKKIVGLLNKNEIQKLERRIEKKMGIEKDAFYLRLLKPELLEGKFVITNSGNCFHFRFSVAAFPKSKEKVIEILKKILNEK